MADYIYLLENRLSQAQQAALSAVRQIARTKGLTVFLVGGAVRDMTSGSPVRDLDVVVQGNALKLKKDIEKAKGEIAGENEAFQVVFARFPGGIRMAIGSTLSVSFPKPGKPVTKPATILDDLRRRDFTANAMALSLNDGSYGLLMDPLNGVADIENRELRLVSSYGFIEDPVRMIRATRLMARLGWHMDEKTQQRYETGKAEGYISTLDAFQRGYETEEIFHEEDPLRVLKRLEAEGWIKHLFPALSSSKANLAELERLRESQMQLEMQGIHPVTSAANFPFLTAKMAPKDVAALKKSFARQGFVQEIAALEGEAKAFATEFSSKGAAMPSQAWKMLHSARPEAVLWTAHTSKNSGIQSKFKGFFTEWALAKQKIPYVMMQEMRITPELPGYDELLDKLFFELMDGKLTTPEEMKAYLEPYSPPAPPPPVHLRRPRAVKKDAKPAKSRKKAIVTVEGEAAAVAPVAAGDKVIAVAPEKTGKGSPAKTAVPEKVVLTKAAAKKADVAVKATAPVKGKVAAKAPAKKAAVVKKVAHKPAPVKKVAAKNAPAKKSVAKKGAPAKKVAKKAPAKKPVAKKAPAKKPVAAKKAVKKAAAPAKKAMKHPMKKKR
jgi:tRNA nucleotidyltransferase (CCA-adding enzyme)